MLEQISFEGLALVYLTDDLLDIDGLDEGQEILQLLLNLDYDYFVPLFMHQDLIEVGATTAVNEGEEKELLSWRGKKTINKVGLWNFPLAEE